jgi:hypothetical protein
MAINYPGPYEVRIAYECTSGGLTIPHAVRFSMDLATVGDPGDPFSAFETANRNGTNTPLDDWVDGMVIDLQPNFRTDSDIIAAELWEYDPGTFNALFLSTYPIAVAGTSTGATQPDTQSIVTFRSTLGGSARLDLRDTIYAPGAKLSAVSAPVGILAVIANLTDVVSPVVARDGGFLFTALNWLPGGNERAFKNRFRN